MIESLDFFLQSGSVVVFALTSDWKTFLYVSPNVEKVLGYSAEELVNTLDFWPTAIHPDDSEHIRVNRIEGENIQIDTRLRRKDGEYIYVRAEASLRRYRDGSVERIVGFFTDRTSDEHQTQHLESKTQKLEDANASLEQFVYIASHDLREPLIGIAGYATLALRRCSTKLEPRELHFLEEIVKGCKNMEQKIDDLLELSRAGQSGSHGSFPLGSAIEQAKRSLVAMLGKSSATVRTTGLPNVRGDRGQIAQLFQNLISNSIKYRGAETPVIEVTVQDYEEDSDWIHVSVKDNGIGFDMRHADRIFGVFQRLYTIEQYPGTGIGLAIVKKIVDVHGGKIWPISNPGSGATFHFTLPKA